MNTRRYRYGVEELDGDQVWAIFEACRHGDVDEVMELLTRDRKLANAQNWYQFPIHFAVREGHLEIVRMLLEAGAEPGRSRFMYNSWKELLETARSRGFDEILELLEQTLRDRFGYHPDFEELKQAIQSTTTARVAELCDRRPELVRASDCYGNNAIHWSVLTRQLDLVDYFLSSGVRANACRADGQTPIHLALNGDYQFRAGRELKGLEVPSPEQIVRHLLDAGAACDLSVASALGDLAKVEAILARDPESAKQLDSGRRSSLMYASRAGHLAIVKKLLDLGADPNRSEELAPRGHALFSASAGNHLEIARLLLACGADPNADSDSSGDCGHIVRHHHKDQAKPMEDLLRAHGATKACWALSVEDMKRALLGDEPITADPEFLAEALARNDIDLLNLMYRQKPEWIQGIHGGLLRTPDPDVAVTDTPVLHWLLEKGFDPDRPDWLGKTALHHYAGRG